MKAKRLRSQVGQRISPYPVSHSKLQVTAACPICLRKSWLPRAFDQVPEGWGGLTLASDPWCPTAIIFRPMVRWPRGPSGQKGFYWEAIPQWQFESTYASLITQVHERFAMRMILWLETMGYDMSSARGRRG
jgi:hypothetical protein